MEDVSFKKAIFETCYKYNIEYKWAIDRGQMDTPRAEHLFGAYRAFDDFIKLRGLNEEYQAFLRGKKVIK